jgi:hypothetical protein
MDIMSGYVISGIVQYSVDCIIAGKNVICPVDEKNRDFERIKNVQEKGICAITDIIRLHIFLYYNTRSSIRG